MIFIERWSWALWHNSLMYITMMKEGLLPISLLPPIKLQELLKELEKAIQITNPQYGIVIKMLHLYYDVKLVTFGINEGKKPDSSIFTFHTAIHTTTADTVLLYNVLPINWYIGNITIKCHNKGISDNRDPKVVLHQEISTLPVNIASDTRCF